jgi:hypothetical protein
MEKEENRAIILTEAEECFCELYVYGGCEFAGQVRKCYEEVFGKEGKNTYLLSRRFLAKPHILARVKELTAAMQSETETLAVKLQITETLKAVMEETARQTYEDRFGISLSPAPLRAVSVNAAKALMELYPVKHAQETKLKVEGADGHVIFNVVVPQTKAKDEDQTDT